MKQHSILVTVPYYTQPRVILVCMCCSNSLSLIVIHKRIMRTRMVDYHIGPGLPTAENPNGVQKFVNGVHVGYHSVSNGVHL